MNLLKYSFIIAWFFDEIDAINDLQRFMDQFVVFGEFHDNEN